MMNDELWVRNGDVEKILMNHMYNMGILKIEHPEKKKDAILDALMGILIRENFKKNDILEFIKDVESDNVLDLKVFENGGNINDYISKKWLKLMNSLWRFRSVGLGTPNAASGEGEFMFIFSSKYIKKPTKGDLSINDEIIELKGSETRVMGKISGKNFRLKSLELCEKFEIIPNKAKVGTGQNKKEINALELEKISNKIHYDNEINKMDTNIQKEFIKNLLDILDDCDKENSISNIFKNEKFDQKELIKEIVKILYSSMIRNTKFNKFIILGDGSNIKVLSNKEYEFNKLIDDGVIVIKGDYFRINQDLPVGWYIE